MRVKVSATGQSYINVPLSKEGNYLFRAYGKGAWFLIIVGILTGLTVITLLAFMLVRYNSKKTFRTA